MSAAEIEDVAARYLVRREEPDWSASDEQAFEAWMRQSMAHRAAFWRLEHAWQQADGLSAPEKPAHAVIADPDARPASRSRAVLPAVARPQRWRATMAAAAAIVIGIVTMLTLPMFEAKGPAPTSYQTVRGGQGVVRLADGSKVELNTATSLRAAAAPDAREVWLDSGEAYFDIVHLPDRRFVVHAGPQTITVLGTRFTVRREGDLVTVAVLSGRVRVENSNASNAGRAALVGRGDVAIARPDATLVRGASADKVEAMAAWRNGMLIFDATPLAAAAAEFNRYNRVPIRVSGELGQLRIGGSFQTRNSAAFLDLLETAYGLKIERSASAVEIRR